MSTNQENKTVTITMKEYAGLIENIGTLKAIKSVVKSDSLDSSKVIDIASIVSGVDDEF